MEKEFLSLRMQTEVSPRLEMPTAEILPEQHHDFFQDRRYDSRGRRMESRPVLNHRM